MRLARRGDYTIEIDNVDLLSGANSITITAIDTLGEQSDTTITINYTPALTWALPDTIAWGSASEIQDVAQIVDGEWHLEGGEVRTQSDAIGYDRLLVVGDHTWTTDYQIEVPLTMHELLAPTGVGLAIGWRGHNGSGQPLLGHPYQMIAWIDGFPNNPVLQFLYNGDNVATEVPISVSLGTRYVMKLRSQSLGGGQSDVRVKLWEEINPEPASWDLQFTFPTLDGSALLIAHRADATFGDVIMTPLSGLPMYDVTTAVTGNGTVTLSPPGGTYLEDTSIIATATPAPGWSFTGWTTGLVGTENPDTLVSLESDTTVTANFIQDTYTLDVTVPGGGGSVLVSPDLPTYLYGDTVILTAVPDSGLVLQTWGGDLTGEQTPDTLIMTGNADVTAQFGPLVYSLDLTVDGMGTAAKSPNKLEYLPGEQVIITASPTVGWVFTGWQGDLISSENPDTVTMNSDLNITAKFSFDSGIVSDDFSSTTLDTNLWTFVDPVGDVTVVNTGTNVLVDIPGGMKHDVWSDCNCAPRFMQPAADADFELELKLDSKLDIQYQLQGFIIGEDFDTYLRFDTHWDGGQVRMFIAYLNGGSASTLLFTSIPYVPEYLQLERSGDDWEFRYSNDGNNWNIGGSATFPITVNEVGFFTGSSQTTDYATPPMVGNVDYFFNVASPITPEDGGLPTAASPPNIEVWYGDDQDFGHMGNPQTLIQVMGRTWDTDALSAMSYRLNGGPSTPINFGDDGFRLERRGEYNIEIDNADLLAGANDLEITAIDTMGEQSDTTITVNYTAGEVWQLPYTIDWGTASEVTDVAQVVDGLWHLEGSDVRTDSAAVGYDRTAGGR